MIHEISSLSSQLEPLSQAHAVPVEDMQTSPSSETLNTVPFFPVTGSVTFHPMTAAPKREMWHLPSGMARLVTTIGLSAALLWPLSGCSNPGENSEPCPTPNITGTTSGKSGIGSANSNCNRNTSSNNSSNGG
jgi:hypothetical protein